MAVSNKFIIAICTLGENTNLTMLLSNLDEIRSKSNFDIEVIVVLNRKENSIVFDPKVRVILEPTRGYSSVRNSAINNVPKNANLIFIDDDEIPTLSWFESLVEMHHKFPDDVIFGPVYPDKFDGSVSYRNRFAREFESLSDGSVVEQCATANMLIPSKLIDSSLVYFDPFFNLSGGEDTDLCFRLRNLGIKIRFAKNAFITEIESEERRSKEYLDSRKVREIVNYSLIVRRNSSLRLRLWRFFTSVVRIVFYSCTSPWKIDSRKMLLAHLKSIRALILGRFD